MLDAQVIPLGSSRIPGIGRQRARAGSTRRVLDRASAARGMHAA